MEVIDTSFPSISLPEPVTKIGLKRMTQHEEVVISLPSVKPISRLKCKEMKQSLSSRRAEGKVYGSKKDEFKEIRFVDDVIENESPNKMTTEMKQ